MRGQRHAPAALYPRERPGTHCTGCWVGPKAGLDRCGKYRPHRDSIPDRLARSQSLYLLRYPAHLPTSACTRSILEVTSILLWISFNALSVQPRSAEYCKRAPKFMTVLSIPINREHPDSGVYFINVARVSPRRPNLKTEAAGTPETSGYTAPPPRRRAIRTATPVLTCDYRYLKTADSDDTDSKVSELMFCPLSF